MYRDDDDDGDHDESGSGNNWNVSVIGTVLSFLAGYRLSLEGNHIQKHSSIQINKKERKRKPISF